MIAGNMYKRISYLISLVGILVAALFSPRVGALSIAAALALFTIPELRTARTLERVIPVALVIALIIVALALPR